MALLVGVSMKLSEIVHRQMGLSRGKAIDKANGQSGRGYKFERPKARMDAKCFKGCQCASCIRPPVDPRLTKADIGNALAGQFQVTHILKSEIKYETQLGSAITKRNESISIRQANQMYANVPASPEWKCLTFGPPKLPQPLNVASHGPAMVTGKPKPTASHRPSGMYTAKKF